MKDMEGCQGMEMLQGHFRWLRVERGRDEAHFP